MGNYYLLCDGANELLFTENETNNERIFSLPNKSPYVKDGIHNFVVHNQTSAVNSAQTGTKAAAHYSLSLAAHGHTDVCLLLSNQKPISAAKNMTFSSKSFD